MKQIGIISDTHSRFCPKVRSFLEQCDEIWHAGDIGAIECAQHIMEFKPTVAVSGNIDNLNKRDYPIFRSFECEGMRVLLTHIGGYPTHYDRAALKEIERIKPDIFVCGHSHILKIMNDIDREMLCINPGSCGFAGFHRVRTAIRMSIDSGKVVELEVGEWRR